MRAPIAAAILAASVMPASAQVAEQPAQVRDQEAPEPVQTAQARGQGGLAPVQTAQVQEGAQVPVQTAQVRELIQPQAAPTAVPPTPEQQLGLLDQWRAKGIDLRGLLVAGYGNVLHGGVKTGGFSAIDGSALLSFDLEKLLGLRGTKINSSYQWYLLRSPSDKSMASYAGSVTGGDLVPVGDVSAIPYLETLTIEQSIGKKFKFEFGKIWLAPLNFGQVCTPPLYCIDPYEKLDAGLPAGPALGFMASYFPDPKLRLSIGAQRLQPVVGGESASYGWDFRSSAKVGENLTKGTSTVATAEYTTDFTDPFPALYAIDLWHANGQYTFPAPSHEQYGFRLRGRKTIWNPSGQGASGFPPAPPTSVAVFGSLGKEFDTTRTIDFWMTAGVSLQSAYRGNGWGVTSINLTGTYAHITTAALLAQQRNSTDGKLGKNNEFKIALSADIFIAGTGISIAPEISYVINPDRGEGSYYPGQGSKLPTNSTIFKVLLSKAL